MVTMVIFRVTKGAQLVKKQHTWSTTPEIMYQILDLQIAKVLN